MTIFRAESKLTRKKIKLGEKWDREEYTPTLKLAGPSEMLVLLYQTTQYHIPGDSI
jgi:hypothetical protein